MKKKIPLHIRKKIVKLERKKHHPLVHHVRKKYGISRKTFFYMKEYGPRSHVSHVIIRESIKILVLASIVSSVGGFALEGVQTKIIALIPLLIIFPAMNDMIGDFGSIISSKFTTILYLGKVKKEWYKSPDLIKLFRIVMAIAVFAAIYLGCVSYFIAILDGFPFTLYNFIRIIEITMISVIFLTILIFLISVISGIYIYKHNQDPNNVLIPITTSIADFGSLVMLTLLIVLFF